MFKCVSNKDKMMRILTKQKPIPYNTIGIIKNKSVEMWLEENSKSIWVKNGYFNYINGDSAILKTFFDTFKAGEYGFSGVPPTAIKDILKAYKTDWIEETERYVLQSSLKPYQSKYKIVDIPLSEAKHIDAHYEYQDETTYDMILEDLKCGPSSGIYINGKLVSYAFAHDDTSLGYMYTLTDYRQLGLAYDVAHDLATKMLRRGNVVFIEIKKGNTASLRLASKLGFAKLCDAPWVGIIK